MRLTARGAIVLALAFPVILLILAAVVPFDALPWAVADDALRLANDASSAGR